MIRVLIERRLRPGTTTEFHQVMRDMFRQAIPTPGYVSGETWRDVSDPHRYVVFSTWLSREHWESWAVSEDRRRIRARIEPLLHQPEQVLVLEPL